MFSHLSSVCFSSFYSSLPSLPSPPSLKLKIKKDTHLGNSGQTLISATLSPSTPCTRNCVSTHDVSGSVSAPIFTVPHMCQLLKRSEETCSCWGEGVLVGDFE